MKVFTSLWGCSCPLNEVFHLRLGTKSLKNIMAGLIAKVNVITSRCFYYDSEAHRCFFNLHCARLCLFSVCLPYSVWNILVYFTGTWNNGVHCNNKVCCILNLTRHFIGRMIHSYRVYTEKWIFMCTIANTDQNWKPQNSLLPCRLTSATRSDHSNH